MCMYVYVCVCVCMCVYVNILVEELGEDATLGLLIRERLPTGGIGIAASLLLLEAVKGGHEAGALQVYGITGQYRGQLK